MLGDEDPAAELLADGASDLRLGHDRGLASTELVLVSGPSDLIELREIVESALGVGTWPTSPQVEGEILRARIRVHRPAVLLGLLMAMEDLIDKRSPWGRWRTVVDTMAARVTALTEITVDVRVVRPTSEPA